MNYRQAKIKEVNDRRNLRLENKEIQKLEDNFEFAKKQIVLKHKEIQELKEELAELKNELQMEVDLEKENEDLNSQLKKSNECLEFTYRKFTDVQKENVDLLKEKNLSDEKQLQDFYHKVREGEMTDEEFKKEYGFDRKIFWVEK